MTTETLGQRQCSENYSFPSPTEHCFYLNMIEMSDWAQAPRTAADIVTIGLVKLNERLPSDWSLMEASVSIPSLPPILQQPAL